MADVHPVLSAPWWLDRLYARLVARQAEVEFYDAYYRGDHPLPWLAPGAHEEFRRILRMTRSNYMGLVIDATAERLQIEGFRLDPAQDVADDETWRIWQANQMDTESDKAVLEALVCGTAYTLVAPNPQDPGTPHVWVEHASQAIVEHEPGSGRRVTAAGLKVWVDDWVGELHATLYLPDGLWKWRAKRPASGAVSKPAWEPRAVAGEAWPAPNSLGVVPLVEWQNNPRLLTGGVSELSDLTDIQDRVNKTIADRLVTQDFGAFPQKWAVAWPDEDEDGNPNTVDIGRNRIVTTDVAETKFGQWDAAPMDPYTSAKREDVKDIASRSRTPAQYLLGEMSNVNGETLKAAESGLVSKAKHRMRSLDGGAEETVHLLRRAAGLPSAGAAIETLWRNPEWRTEGELTDAVVKRRQTGIASLRQAREDVGYSATQIARLEADDRAEALDPVAAQLLRASGGVVA